MSVIRISTELFSLSEDTLKQINKKRYYQYKARFSDQALEQLERLDRAYYHVANLFKIKYGYSSVFEQNGHSIVSVANIENPVLNVFNREKEDRYKIEIIRTRQKIKLNFFDGTYFKPLRNMFYQAIHDSLLKLGFEFSGYSYYSKSEDLTKDFPSSKNSTLRKIQNFFHLFPGFNIKLRVFEQKPFLQIQPRCVVHFEKDLYSLYNEDLFSFDEMVKTFPQVLLPIGRTARLQTFWKKKVSEPINDKVFGEQSFLQFAKRMYPNLDFKKTDANLVVVVPGGNRSVPWYFSSELVTPSLGFESISRMDRNFHSRMLSEMKVYSARRKDLLREYVQKIDGKMSFDGTIIGLSEMVSHESSMLELRPQEFARSDIPILFRFPRPWVRFKDAETLKPKDVSRETGHLGAPGDLLREPKNVCCLDVPKEISVKLLIAKMLEDDVWKLIRLFGEGYGNYKGFKDVFGVDIKFSSILIDDFLSDLSVYSKITPENDDCVLIFGPRTIEGDPIKTKKIYTFSETQILNKGVPVQFVADAPSPNPKYDMSLKSKSTNPDALFGIGLNILGKIGAYVLTLSPNTTDYFLPGSVVIGYNIARIFEPLKKDIFQDKTPKDLVTHSIPLAAPIVILSGHGADIIQQYAYEVADETALFSGEQGRRIISDIGGNPKNIVIHKDGEFYPEEIRDLKILQQNGARIIPISIISGSVPRLFSSLAEIRFLPPEGTVFMLSPNDFLISTTLTGARYIPEHRGWPNPILVRFHEKPLSQKLSSQEKLQLLYQIWAFTRVHVHSQIPLRKPISVHYSNLIATFLRKAGDRKPQYFKKFKGKKNRLGYNPRIFL